MSNSSRRSSSRNFLFAVTFKQIRLTCTSRRSARSRSLSPPISLCEVVAAVCSSAVVRYEDSSFVFRSWLSIQQHCTLAHNTQRSSLCIACSTAPLSLRFPLRTGLIPHIRNGRDARGSCALWRFTASQTAFEYVGERRLFCPLRQGQFVLVVTAVCVGLSWRRL